MSHSVLAEHNAFEARIDDVDRAQLPGANRFGSLENAELIRAVPCSHVGRARKLRIVIAPGWTIEDDTIGDPRNRSA